MSYICSFFGHRDIYDSDIKTALSIEIARHIAEYNVDTFYVGGYGDFDAMAVGILYEMKERYPHISTYRILAYLPTKSEGENYGKLFPTLFPEGLELVPRKFAISHRNRWIVNQSDYIIAYVAVSYGGAYEALKYAKQKKSAVVNLADTS